MMESKKATTTVNYEESMKKVKLLLEIIHIFSSVPYAL